MKKKIILSAVLSIVLCLSLISGATMALFTSESKVNIAVTSGKVNVVATVDSWELYSLNVAQAATFENGGTVEYKDGEFIITNITPGDKVVATIKVANNSNVSIKYRVKFEIAGELVDALVTSVESGADKWTSVAPNATITDIKLSIELPIDANDDYQEKSAAAKIIVEAVQGNGVVAVDSPAELAQIFAEGANGISIALDSTVAYGEVAIAGELKDVVIEAANAQAKFVLGANAKLENVTIKNLNGVVAGNAITIPATAVVKDLVIEDSKFTNTVNKPNGAIALTNSAAEITFKNCEFSSTKYAVYGQTPAAELVFDGCTFEGATSWVVLLNGGDATAEGAKLTITNCTFINCTGGIAKYLGSTQPAGAYTVFTNNTLVNCKGHDGSDAKWFTIPGAVANITVSGNTLNGADWAPTTANGLGK